MKQTLDLLDNGRRSRARLQNSIFHHILEPVEFRGAAGSEDLKRIRQQGQNLARQVRECSLADCPI